MRGIEGKSVIVTGAGRRLGLGEGIARRFVEEGANVLIADLDRPSGEHFPEHGVPALTEMEQVVADLRALDRGRVDSAICDVRDEQQVEAAVDQAVEVFGGVDVVINNAGIGYLMSPIVDTSLEDFEVVLDVNLVGTFLTTKHAGRRMIAQGRGGRIINISSQGGKSGFPHAGAYVSSKHAVIGFTRTAAIEFGPHGITVNAVCPNHVTTGLGSWQNEYFSKLLGQTLDEYMEGMRSRIPMGRNGTPGDIAAACVFLASDDGEYISGDALNVSGGEETH